MNDLPTLEGRLVTLGRFNPEYDPVYLRWMQDEHILKMTGSEKITGLDGIRELREYFVNSFSMAHFLIFDKEGHPIGDTDLRSIRPGEMAESTIMIAEYAWRKRGYAREAYDMLLRFGFDNLALQGVYAKVLHDNKASIALHERLGFRRTCIAEDYALFERPAKQERYLVLPGRVADSTQSI